jgi:hypothetical protein
VPLKFHNNLVDIITMLLDKQHVSWYNQDMKNKVIRTNRYNQQLVDCGTHWAIVTPRKEDNSGIVCNCHHTGSEKYIKNIWNKKYCIIYSICPVTKCLSTVYGKPNIDRDILV